HGVPVPATSLSVPVVTGRARISILVPYTTLFRSKAADCTHPALHVLLELTSTVPVNPVTVLLKVSWAVTLTLKGVPAVWVPMARPEEHTSVQQSTYDVVCLLLVVTNYVASVPVAQ